MGSDSFEIKTKDDEDSHDQMYSNPGSLDMVQRNRGMTAGSIAPVVVMNNQNNISDLHVLSGNVETPHENAMIALEQEKAMQAYSVNVNYENNAPPVQAVLVTPEGLHS